MLTEKEDIERIDREYGRPYGYDHHYYGHAADLSDVDFARWMFGIPLAICVIVLALVTGLWPLLILYWLWTSRKKGS